MNEKYTHLMANRAEIFEFVQRIVALHWVDCHRFPTNSVVIQSLAELSTIISKDSAQPCKLTAFLHSTPRQIQVLKFF